MWASSSRHRTPYVGFVFVTAGDNSVTISVGILTKLHVNKTNSSGFWKTLKRVGWVAMLTKQNNRPSNCKKFLKLFNGLQKATLLGNSRKGSPMPTKKWNILWPNNFLQYWILGGQSNYPLRADPLYNTQVHYMPDKPMKHTTLRRLCNAMFIGRKAREIMYLLVSVHPYVSFCLSTGKLSCV